MASFNITPSGGGDGGVEEASAGEEDSTYVDYEHRPETYIVPIVMGLIFMTGALGNGSLVRIFYKHKSMRTTPNVFILCLAIGDLMVMTGCLPFVSLIYTVDSWPFGEVVCKLSEFLRDLSTSVTVYSLTALSMDRYLAISSPYRIIRDNTNEVWTRTVVILIWFVSSILSLPSAQFSHLRQAEIGRNKTIEYCYPFPGDPSSLFPRLIITIKFLLYYILPLIVIATFYALMAKSLLQNAIFVSPESFATRQRQKRVKISKMVLALVIIFALCFLPNHVFLLWYYYGFPDSYYGYNQFWHIFKISGYVLTFLNSCINPIVLYCISHRFRCHFRQELGCLKKETQRSVLRRKSSIHHNHHRNPGSQRNMNNAPEMIGSRLDSTRSTLTSDVTKV